MKEIAGLLKVAEKEESLLETMWEMAAFLQPYRPGENRVKR